jgi:hypothetical protein
MNVRDAIDRVDQIHDQLARSEVYRGLRVPAVALVGVLGIVAAVVQTRLPGAASGIGFVYYWVGVAGVGGMLGVAVGLRAYLFREDEFARRRTRRVIFQFAPCLIAGAAATAGVVRGGPELVALLPGLWAMMFGLGVIAVSPYLPPGVGAIGFGYVMAGATLLLKGTASAEPPAWAVGGVFGVGHLATALALWHGEGNDDA